MRRYLLIALLIVALSSIACVRRPLERYDFKTTDIKVAVDINAICNVTCDVYNDKIPIPPIESEVMRVLFFHPSEDRLMSEAFVSDKGVNDKGEAYIGGKVSVVPGTYRVLIYSFGTESTLIGDYSSFDKSRAYAEPLNEIQLLRYALKSEDKPQTIFWQPDHLLVARSHKENIPFHSGTYTIHASASSIVESYYLQVKVDGLEYVKSAQAILSGMAPSKSLASGEMDEEHPVAIHIPLLKSKDKDEDVVCNVFNTFGRIPDSDNELTVTFDLTATDGRKYTRSFNIGELFNSEECIKHHWLLLEEHIKVEPPEKPEPGGGFDPAVEDWTEEHRDISI